MLSVCQPSDLVRLPPPCAAPDCLGCDHPKTFKPASTYWQYPIGIRDGFWTPAQIPIAECYVFAVHVEGQPVEAFYSLNTTAAKAFEVGQRVEIVYEERGIPPIWQRVYVMDMRPAGKP